MPLRIRLLTFGLAAILVAPFTALVIGAGKGQRVPVATGPRFNVSFTSSAHADAITGRVYVAISKRVLGVGAVVAR